MGPAENKGYPYPEIGRTLLTQSTQNFRRHSFGLLVEYAHGIHIGSDLDTTTSLPAEIINRVSPPEGIGKAHCVWCGRAFSLRKTGGSAQRFCCLEHRKAFWTAARRWTMRAIETGLLSVECLKGHHTSVHAAGKAFRSGGYGPV
jgi:hypothetical protein